LVEGTPNEIPITHDIVRDWGQARTVCPEISQSTEKNWSFWLTDDDAIRFSYNICPTHDVYEVNVQDDPGGSTIVTCGGTKLNEWDCRPECVRQGRPGLGREKTYPGGAEDDPGPPCDFLVEFQSYYGRWGAGNHGPAMKVSITTPAIPFGEEGYRLGVGHIKFHFTDNDLIALGVAQVTENAGRRVSPDPSAMEATRAYKEHQSDLPPSLAWVSDDRIHEAGATHLMNFVIEAKRQNLGFHRHPHPFIYLMYLYKFDVRDGNVTHISDMFLPEGTTLCFPSGLTQMNPQTHPRDILLTYGNMDASCEAMVLTYDIINRMLRIPTNDIQPQIVKFLWIPRPPAGGGGR